MDVDTPIGSIYGIFTYIYHKPYAIHVGNIPHMEHLGNHLPQILYAFPWCFVVSK